MPVHPHDDIGLSNSTTAWGQNESEVGVRSVSSVRRGMTWAKRPFAKMYLRSLRESPKDGLFKALAYITIAVLLYIGMVFVFEIHYFVPYDNGFAVVLLWASSMVGGQLARLVGLPQLLGMLCAGILLKNAGDPVRGLHGEVSAAIRAFGLMNILMRGGLEMDLGAVKRMGWAVIRLTVLPGVTEAFTGAALGVALFQMPFFLALSMGFILAAVSPAVVVGGMFDLQSRGYGVAEGIPSLVVAAASFDDVVAISGFSMCIGLAIGTGNIVLEALHGPINIVAGVSFGAMGACLLSCTRIWDSRAKRCIVLLLLGVGFTFSSKLAHFSGAGALASLVMAAASAQLWAAGSGGPLSVGPLKHAAHEAEEDLCAVWRFVAEPLLFSVIGAALDFSKVSADSVEKAICVILVGVVVRCAVAFFATCGTALVFRERLFVALAWMPKATVQAALASYPLDLAREMISKDEDPDKFARYEAYGSAILTTAVFSILITAPAGLLVIQWLGPLWLQQVPAETKVVPVGRADTEDVKDTP
eukprot:CAMPEP_0176079620 /NCGR_PEP_ID=MMETSP0120_2-20121206/39822_1 /TAXON_ID=160619 /ORGANISM="Kryptoperidinium foliaceum, Strain CCMP 1326" /LENGTH=529 /DNA_ID=CAMNT_0017413377 /DNA_START=42 /DNA_END=1631 /DNA_ORIENTATION=+